MRDKTVIRYSRRSEPELDLDPNSDKPEKPKQSAKAYAVWLLSKREYSAANLEKKLLARGYDADETATTMEFLRTQNYQSDARYAEIKARGTAHRAGDWKIAMSLAQQGIQEDLAKEQIAGLPPEDERAAQAADAKFSRQVAENGLSPELTQKIWRYLAYRGFSGKAIKHALNVLKDIADS